MLIAITGGSGFIGRHLIKKLIESDYELVLLGKTPYRPQILNLIKTKRVGFIKYNLIEGDPSISKILRNVDALIHLAAFVPRSNNPEDDDPIKSIEVNIRGTYNLLRDFEPLTKKIVFASTLEVYGKPVTLPISELHPTNPLTYYGVSKLVGEKYVLIFSQRHSLKNIILRFSTVYGPGEAFNRAIPNFIRCTIKDEPPVIYGDGLDVRDYIYVGDVVDGIIAAMQGNCTGIYNIASGKGFTIRETAEKIIQISGKNLKPVFKPREEAPTKFIFDITNAKKDLHFFPKISIEKGLSEEIVWYKRICKN